MNRAPIRIGFGLVALLVLGAPALAALPVVEFDTPAQANGDLVLTDVQWVLLVFRESSDAQFTMDLQPESTINHSVAQVQAYRPGIVTGELPPRVDQPPEPMQGDFRARLTFGQAWSSLYIEATSIQIEAADTEALLAVANGQTVFGEYLPDERDDPTGTYRNEATPAGLFWSIDSPKPSFNMAMTLQAEGIHRLEWHNATLDCSGESCLDGAKDQGRMTPIPGGWIGSRILSYREVISSTGLIQGSATPWAVLVGGSRLTTEIDGWLRLPNAHIQGDCNDAPCADPGGRTLQVQGQVVLQDLAPIASDRRVTSQFYTSEAVARIDESPTFRLEAGPAWTLAAVSGAAGLLVIFGRPLLGLFARNTRPLLEHPRAKAIHDLVHATPGISFGQVRQSTGWGHGTVHYHLKRLLKAGLIVAYTYRNSVRYYQNHGRHKHDWKEHAALRHPELQTLHGWIAEHPRASQVEVIAAARAWGWKRSTTQDRLAQLLEAALVEVQRGGISVAYVAVRPASH